MIRTVGLSKTFTDPKKGSIEAVSRVDLEAQPGKVFGLLGVNGAGKTTCLRLLSTILKPTAGSAMVAGYDCATQSEDVRRNIGFLSASTALYGRLTGDEVLAYFGGLFGLSGTRLKERLDFVKAAMRLHEFSGQLCDKMSTGQKQRVSIARAILHDPPVLFFDEPTAGLDVVTSQTVMEFIESVRDQGKTVVFSTHIMSEAERLCDEIAVIHQGKVLTQGSKDAFLKASGQSNLERAFLATIGYQSEVTA